MVTQVSRDGLPSAFIEAAERFAVGQAELTSAWFDACGFAPGTIRAPAAFLLELGAVLQLGEWELAGVTTLLDLNLPPYREAADDLLARVTCDPSQFHRQDSCKFSTIILGVWIERFAWECQRLLQANIVFGHSDDDAFVQNLAAYLWHNRTALQNLSSELC
jgi:hypothetical protein